MANEKNETAISSNGNARIDTIHNQEENCVRIIKEWLKKRHHLPQNISDNDIVRFLHCSQCSIEKTKLVIDAYYTIRTHTPELFQNRDPTNRKFKETAKYLRAFLLDDTAVSGEQILFVKLDDTNPDIFDYVECTRYGLALMDLFLEFTTHKLDFIVIMDVEGVGLGHLAKVAAHPHLVKSEIDFVQEALPFNLKGFHVINAGSVIDTIVAFFKPMIRSYLFQILHFYSPDSIHKLYSIVPQKILPKEYGGDTPSCKEQSDVTYKIFLKGGEILKRKELQVVNEKLRDGPSRYDDSMGLQGAFKKLDLD